MRTLNNREKTFIKDMLEATNSGKAITINQILEECFFTREKETALVLHENNNLIAFYTPYDTPDHKKQQLFLEYMEIYELIRYLLEMKYIYKHRVWDLKDKLRIISKKSDTKYSIEKTCNLELIPK